MSDLQEVAKSEVQTPKPSTEEQTPASAGQEPRQPRADQERKPRQRRPKTDKPKAEGQKQVYRAKGQNEENAANQAEEGKDQQPREPRQRRPRREKPQTATADPEEETKDEKPAGDQQARRKTRRPRRQADDENADQEQTEQKEAQPKRTPRAKSAMRRRDQNEEDALDNLDKPASSARGGRGGKREKSVGVRKQVDRSGQKEQYTPYAPKRAYRSKYQEFMAAEWRYFRQEINITTATEIPAMPKSKKQEPNDTEYHKNQLEIDEKVDQLYKELTDFAQEYKAKQREMNDEQQGKGAGWRELREHFDEQKVHLTQKRAIMQLREKADNEVQSLVKEIAKLNRQCHPTYNTLEDLDKGIKILNRRIETNTLTSQVEGSIIKEINQIKASRPLIAQKAKLQQQIDDLRSKQKKDSEDLPEIKKLLGAINSKIEKVKKEHKDIDNTKESYTSQLEQIDHKRSKIRDQIADLKAKKNKAKEDYYELMIAYEVEQKFIKDILWLEKTKEAFMQRKQRQEDYLKEKRIREEARRRYQEQRAADQKRYEEEQARRKADQAEQQRIWEAQQLKRVEMHPYTANIETCENLIFYCSRTFRKHTQPDAAIDTEKNAQDQQKIKGKMDSMVSNNKMQAFDRVNEREQPQRKQKERKKRDGGSLMYEDDNNLALDYPMIQKFGKVAVSPPVDVDELPKIEKSLQQVRDALKVKGSLEILENKAKLLKDDSWCKGEQYEKLQEELKQFDSEVLKKLETIKKDNKNWTNDDDGINVDEELDEEEIGERLTKLRPEQRGPRRDQGGRGGRDGGRGGYDRDRRGRSQAARPRREQHDDMTEEPRQRAQPRKQEKFNGGNTEDFPML